MLTLLLAAQLAAAVPRDTATYSSPALRALISEAARVNNHVPPALGGYTAKLESEIAIGERDGAGHETEESLEQAASSLRWSRTGDFEQHVIGYRSQALGFQFATIGFFGMHGSFRHSMATGWRCCSASIRHAVGRERPGRVPRSRTGNPIPERRVKPCIRSQSTASGCTASAGETPSKR